MSPAMSRFTTHNWNWDRGGRLRGLVAGLLVVMGLGGCSVGERGADRAGERGKDAGWSFADLERAAAGLLAEPYAPSPALPERLAAWDYDDYRKVWFWPSAAVWPDDRPFRAAFFHRGYLHHQQMNIFLVDDGRATPVRFDPAMFHYGDVAADAPTQDIGFAGFRLHAPLTTADSYDELASFIGASYFRALGRGQIYGSSARGIGVDMGSFQERFPAFTAAYLHQPKPGDTAATVDLLLDGEDVVGAFRLRIIPPPPPPEQTPGNLPLDGERSPRTPCVGLWDQQGDTSGGETVIEVHAVLFARQKISRLNIAPLTSMFWLGEHQPSPHDPRPEVHDADLLLVRHADGTTIARPLTDPDNARRTRFAVDELGGFGLMQRDRDPAHYMDPEALYERRPSIWVEPMPPAEGQPAWPAGAVELLELPTDSEYQDNIGVSWVPSEPLDAGQRLEVSYRLRWTTHIAPPGNAPGSTPGSTTGTPGTVPGSHLGKNTPPKAANENTVQGQAEKPGNTVPDALAVEVPGIVPGALPGAVPGGLARLVATQRLEDGGFRLQYAWQHADTDAVTWSARVEHAVPGAGAGAGAGQDPLAAPVAVPGAVPGAGPVPGAGAGWVASFSLDDGTEPGCGSGWVTVHPQQGRDAGAMVLLERPTDAVPLWAGETSPRVWLVDPLGRVRSEIWTYPPRP